MWRRKEIQGYPQNTQKISFLDGIDYQFIRNFCPDLNLGQNWSQKNLSKHQKKSENEYNKQVQYTNKYKKSNNTDKKKTKEPAMKHFKASTQLPLERIFKGFKNIRSYRTQMYKVYIKIILSQPLKPLT
ncbi:unnamed protein product [Paramecium primaurelia]|uniref:Uncharacterized protein n=1 Tax=Paramecium primaurelia TaxID=5886 RepID=A0A8S1M5K3_PARPR|nr:unnamed protein product [Paramecium primaurelia]